MQVEDFDSFASLVIAESELDATTFHLYKNMTIIIVVYAVINGY